MNGLITKFTLSFILLFSSSGIAQQVIWQDVSPLLKNSSSSLNITRYYDTDDTALRTFLELVPNQLSGQSLTINLPMPDGSLSLYSITEAPVMAAALAAKYPHIKSFKVYGIDDPGASGRVDISSKGFRAMLTTAMGRVFIDPDLESNQREGYQSRLRGARTSDNAFQCGVTGSQHEHDNWTETSNKTALRIPGSFQRYRLAVSATPQYVAATGGNLNNALAEINTAINRVNEIYERDLGINLQLVGNNDLIIDVDGTNGFNNDDVFAMLDQNQAWVDNLIEPANYDIGHIFSTADGGVAILGSVCDDMQKAQGATGLTTPTGDLFYIDFVAHEIGHQFSADHTFNGTEGSCGGGNRNATTAFEPGSGSTIMGYAGICDDENIQPASNATFHAGTISQVNAFVTSGTGANCGSTVAINNPAEPTADAGADFTIPISTAFALAGSGSDGDGDTLSFQWDQMDAGTATGSNNGQVTPAGNLGDDLGNNALFRSLVPGPVAMRNMPALGTQIGNEFDKSEVLPCRARDLNFRLTVRDGKSGQASDDVKLTVDSSSGPFVMTSHTASATTITSINGGEDQTVTWNTANTNNAAVACNTVDIDLLTFSAGHASYSVTSLEAATPNDGDEIVNIPNSSNNLARFRIKCSTNIFYDISDVDLQISGTGTFSTDQNTTVFNTNIEVISSTAGSCRTTGGGTGGGGSGNTSGGFNDTATGTGAMDKSWLLFMLTLFGLTGLLRMKRFIKVCSEF